MAHYIGETHRTFYDRSLEQVKNLRNKQESSALYKHWQICHPEMSEAQEFSHTCLKTYKTSTERQVGEAVMIDNLPCDIIMNSKSEFRQNSLVRHRIEFKGAIWQENLPGAPETGDQNKSGTPNPPEPVDDSSFSNQFKQRKLKRKVQNHISRMEPLHNLQESPVHP